MLFLVWLILCAFLALNMAAMRSLEPEQKLAEAVLLVVGVVALGFPWLYATVGLFASRPPPWFF